jgi:hypothetical protein
MTDQEHEDMVRTGKDFWLDFSDLCNKYIAYAPPHLRAEYETYLGEQTSIYGRKN